MRVVPLFSSPQYHAECSLFQPVSAQQITRQVMNLQEYVKYLICVIFVQSPVLHGKLSVVSAQNTRVERGVLDLLAGFIRTCGPCVCGKSNRSSARLLGGETTQSHEFPWLCNIHVKSEQQVSGVLINDRYVLTAASQLVGATPPEVKVTLGAFDRCYIDVSSVNISVEEIIRYPEFISETHAHDLALIRLSHPVLLNKRILPVCLSNPNSKYLGQVGTLVGWTESSSDNSKPSCLPRKLGLPILGRSECIKSGIEPNHYHEDSGCIGVVGGNSIVCDNDVGTSVLYRSYTGVYDLIGILSNGNKCGDDSKQTAVYTRVGPHFDWILQRTQDACYCTK